MTSLQKPWLDLENVQVKYRTRYSENLAVEGLSFGVAEGEFVAVLGPSGCGKSTLLRLIAGLILSTAGSVSLGGVAVTGPRKDVGMVFQQATLLPWNTVINNVLAPARILGERGEAPRQRATRLLEMVGLSDFIDRYPHELSGGMQQRVGIARSLIHNPRILLMDEPFAALDALTRETMALELQSLWQQAGRTVLFITHSISEAVFLADRVLVLSKRPGHVIHEEKVSIPRPRDLSSLASPEFASVCDRLRRLFVH